MQIKRLVPTLMSVPEGEYMKELWCKLFECFCDDVTDRVDDITIGAVCYERCSDCENCEKIVKLD